MTSRGPDGRVSLVVATLNEERHVVRYLQSAFSQTFGSDRYEVILVDGASEDATVEHAIAAAHAAGSTVRRVAGPFVPKSLLILDNPERAMPIAFKIGAGVAAAEVVIITGAHSELGRDFVRASIEALEETGAAVVGGHAQIVNEDPRMALAQRSPIATGGASYRTPGISRREVDTVPFPAFRRSTWEDVGRFDEELLRNQDDEFILRIRQGGGKAVISPDIRFTYFARPSFARLRRQYYEYGLYRILTTKKRGRPGSSGPLAPFALVPARSQPP